MQVVRTTLFLVSLFLFLVAIILAPLRTRTIVAMVANTLAGKGQPSHSIATTSANDSQRIVLYTSKVCPFAHRAALALEETGTPYHSIELPILTAKPNWYTDSHHPLHRQVPSIVIEKIDKNGEPFQIDEYIESVNLIKLIGCGNLPNSQTKLSSGEGGEYQINLIYSFCMAVSPGWISMLQGSCIPIPRMIENLSFFFSNLPKHVGQSIDQGGPFIGGKQGYGMVEAGISPFIGRILLLSKNGLLAGESGKQIWNSFSTLPQFENARNWWNAVESRESWKKTFDKEYILETHRKKFQERKL